MNFIFIFICLFEYAINQRNIYNTYNYSNGKYIASIKQLNKWDLCKCCDSKFVSKFIRFKTLLYIYEKISIICMNRKSY